MAKDYEFSMWGHPSIYDEESKERKLNIYFSEPQNGVNEDTGIVLLVPGFGGNAKSKVYKKMRNEFADKYNLITVQCDYFGWQFMRDDDFDVSLCLRKEELAGIFTKDEIYNIYEEKAGIQRFLEISNKYAITVPFEAKLGESLADFNDMGIMQAIDNTTAVLAVMAILDDNGLNFNKKKNIIYGHSHGAYLAHLCNVFAPELFSMIIDNSAWLFPEYMGKQYHRLITQYVDKVTMHIRFYYLAKKLEYDNEILSLPFLYKQFKNNCDIISFHGITDGFNNFIQKEKLCSDIENSIFTGIYEDGVDGQIFKSTEHGLGADFLKFFDYVLEKYPPKSKGFKTAQLSQVTYTTTKHMYKFDYSTGVPVLKVENIC